MNAHMTLRDRLRESTLMLLFTPAVCAGDPFEVLDAVLPFVDIVQVRPKPLGARGPAPCPARETFDWTRRILERLRERRLESEVLVLVDDRIDVALALADEGCAGVHLGEHDCEPIEARAALGPTPLIGYSTHSLREVAQADELPVDYLGFGPVQATATKGYDEGLGSARAWVASGATPKPVFPIGGIDTYNAAELEQVGRAAVGSAILAAGDPARAAKHLWELLRGE